MATAQMMQQSYKSMVDALKDVQRQNADIIRQISEMKITAPDVKIPSDKKPAYFEVEYDEEGRVERLIPVMEVYN